MIKKFLILAIFFFLSNNYSHASDVPIIVIAPSKKPQSISTVGSSVIVLDEKFFDKNNEYFLGDVLSNYSTSTNFFQSGGHGTASAIQLRGLPKRYSTVYIDGVKMSDPSSVSGDFDFNHILTSQISRVEILKGSQSSVYGSGAIGGTINITTKKRTKNHKGDFFYNTGSHGTNNISFSKSGEKQNLNYLISYERFQTDGISQMSHNEEKDSYRNNSLLGKLNNQINDFLEFEGSIRLRDTYLQYDKVIDTASATHSEEEDGKHYLGSGVFTYKFNEKFTNKLSLSSTYIKRSYDAAAGSGNLTKDNYYGERYSYGYNGLYNLDLDKSLIFGVEREDEQIGYNKDLTGIKRESYYTTSSFYDYQQRFTNNLYATFGSRFDDNSVAGDEESHRATVAYIFDDKKTKLKSSFGTGFRYPSLYEMYYVYAANADSLPYVKAEKSKSFDIGIEKTYNKLNYDLTYFNTSYSNVLEGWKTGNSSGANYTTQNMPGTVKSEGIEFVSNLKLNSSLNLGLNYTYTNSYDGAEQDDPDKSSSILSSQMVRVPRHLINLNTQINFPNFDNLNMTINTKWSEDTRDYGNGNRTYNDERIDSYLVNDLIINYKLFNTYNAFLNITNIFDENYETAKDYSQMERSLNIGLKRAY